MTFDAGRIRHDGALMHYSRASNGTSIPSNWRLSATGDTGVAWAPESASSVSYASNSNDVGNASAAGASSLVSPADHVHRGVHLVSSNGSNSLYGDVNLQAGTGIALGVAGQSITVTNTGSAGGGTSVSYASNSNEVSYANAPGASSLVSHADHIHRGVTSVSHTSNTFTGPVILTTSGVLGITVPTPGTLNFSATGGAGGGSSITDYVSGASGTGHINIPGLAGSADIRVAGTNDDEFDTTDTSDPMTGWTTLGAPTHDINSTVLSHYYVSTPANASRTMQGIYKACPSLPFTMSAKMTAAGTATQFNTAGIWIAEAPPGKLEGITLRCQSVGYIGQIGSYTMTSPTGTAAILTNTSATHTTPIYLRIVAISSTNVEYWYSGNGVVWIPINQGHNPGFTIGNVVLAVMSESSSLGIKAAFDWVRFT